MDVLMEDKHSVVTVSIIEKIGNKNCVTHTENL